MLEAGVIAAWSAVRATPGVLYGSVTGDVSQPAGMRCDRAPAARSVHDLPGSARLSACGAIRLLAAAADVNRLGEFPTILTADGLVGVGRRDRAVVAAVRIAPGRGGDRKSTRLNSSH